jgi:hypothetical protein
MLYISLYTPKNKMQAKERERGTGNRERFRSANPRHPTEYTEAAIFSFPVPLWDILPLLLIQEKAPGFYRRLFLHTLLFTFSFYISLS